MKLLLCTECLDIKTIYDDENTHCRCGVTSKDNGNGRLLEIDDGSLSSALKEPPHISVMFYIKLTSR